MSQLEDLLVQWYDWRGYVIRRNVKVGRLPHGGWEGELDIVAYHPVTQELVHLEPSIDALSWDKREQRFARKFTCGKKYVWSYVFPWLESGTPLRQVAVLISRGKERTSVGGGEVITIDEIMAEIKADVFRQGKMAAAAIPEQFDLLRTIQLALCGYYRVV